ncbi:MAG: nitrile hydratase subunit alpha, partial [Rhodospirillales bacterium]|nr:nitrile hydratase subunit alpha [Rhodospirillales bacterium]
MSEHGHDHLHDEEESGIALRVKALERVLVEKGAVNAEALDKFVDAYETKIGPRNGAMV